MWLWLYAVVVAVMEVMVIYVWQWWYCMYTCIYSVTVLFELPHYVPGFLGF